MARNRYLNVEPFANKRVKLRVAEGINDYINASPISLGKRRYIATQGPKDTSVSHFYRMLAAETGQSGVVVMLTQTHEAGREKCFQYFPMDGASSPLPIPRDPEIEDDFHGEVTLLSSEEDSETRSTIRRMKLRTTTEPEAQEKNWHEQEIWHLLFGGWPDFLIPEGDDREALIQLVKLSRTLNYGVPPPKKNSFHLYEDRWQTPQINGTESPATDNDEELNPRIVHCSAGVGRSGTFIALDHLLHLLDKGDLDSVGQDTDPIAQTVDQLRQQRMMMVQGESQFMMLYDLIKEAWIERWRKQQAEKAPPIR